MRLIHQGIQRKIGYQRQLTDGEEKQHLLHAPHHARSLKRMGLYSREQAGAHQITQQSLRKNDLLLERLKQAFSVQSTAGTIETGPHGCHVCWSRPENLLASSSVWFKSMN